MAAEGFHASSSWTMKCAGGWQHPSIQELQGKHMDFELSPKVKDLQRQISDFMNENVYPIEKRVDEEMNQPGHEHTEPQVLKDVRKKAKAAGLWNLFLPDAEDGKGLKVAEYAPLCEIMGRLAPVRSIAWRPTPAIWKFSPNSPPPS